MKITIEPTPTLVKFDGVECRQWKGATEGGIKVSMFVHRVVVRGEENQEPFEHELAVRPEPTAVVPLRHLL